MNLHLQRIFNVQQSFDNKDYFLGFRKLLDCVIDTQNMPLYREAIELTDWKENHPDNTEELVLKVNILLEKLKNVSPVLSSRNLPVLIANHITKSYRTNQFSLQGGFIEIYKGQVFGLVGENGNGKTTFLRILAHELTFDGGELQYNFQDKPKNAFHLRSRLVYIPQRTAKWYGSLLDNLRFVLSNYEVNPDEIEPRVLMMVARLGLWKYKDLQWHQLSSGYKMRFELARTLLRKPEILLLDEPLANLDIMSQQIILEDLKSMANSLSHPMAIVLSSQQLYEVEKISDEVIFLNKGKQSSLNANQKLHSQHLMLEIDTKITREKLVECLQKAQLKSISYNGGIYIAEFLEGITFSQVLSQIANDEIPLVYIRDITSSTRRFFVK